ncbi:MAG: ABC transporter ATP-binding protein [Thaumarchaeota archaeon]|nr:MAG: ABC transporter ATP-binding protein [Nitrososphaerota archaeon]
MITAEYRQSNSMLLQVREVSKTYLYANNQKHVVLNRVSIDINEGEFVTIVGPSGCGKSTLLNIIAGLDRPDSGSIWVKGKHKTSTDPGRLVIFQEGALFPWLSVLENVEFGLKLAGVPKSEQMQAAIRFINMVQLSKFADSFIYQLSGGMKQRVAIARALAMNPDILLMDEPFAAVDMQTREMLHNQLLQIHDETKKTILFVTHNLNEALALGTRLIVLSPRLGSIKREFSINLPRPRDVESPQITVIKRQILKELEEEFQFVRRENTVR